MSKKKNFWKRNWDLVTMYGLFTLSLVAGFLISFTCSGWDCLGIFLPILISTTLFIPLIIISIVRTVRNKDLPNSRWWWIFIPMVLAILLIFSNPFWVNLFNPLIWVGVGV